MSDPTPVVVPVTPWYKSQILQGILVAVITQLVAHSNLAGIVTSDQVAGVVNWILEGISAAAAAYAARARIVGPVHPIAGTKTAQNAALAKLSESTPTPAEGSAALVTTATLVPVPTDPGQSAVSSQPNNTQEKHS